MNKRTFYGFIALVIAVIIGFGATIAWGIGSRWGEIKGFKNYFNGWGHGISAEQPKDPDADNSGDEDNDDPQLPVGGVVKHNGSFVATTYSLNENLMSLASEALSDEIMTTAEGGFTLTATVQPADADNKAVTWSVSWDNPNSAWAKGKTVTDYVTITPTAAGSLTATANCKAAFGEKIKITVTSQDNPEASAMCVCDYVKRITGLTFTAGELYFPSTGYTYTVETSPYTIDSTVNVTVGKLMILNSDFANAVTTAFGKVTTKYRYQTDWWFASDKSAGITTNYTTKQITFTAATKDFANCFTSPDDEYSSSEIAEMRSYINSAFRNAVNSYSGVHATFTVSYTAAYNGTTYTSGTKTVECRFNYTSLKVPVGSLALNSGSIVF